MTVKACQCTGQCFSASQDHPACTDPATVHDHALNLEICARCAWQLSEKRKAEFPRLVWFHFRLETFRQSLQDTVEGAPHVLHHEVTLRAPGGVRLTVEGVTCADMIRPNKSYRLELVEEP